MEKSGEIEAPRSAPLLLAQTARLAERLIDRDLIHSCKNLAPRLTELVAAAG